MGHFTEIRYGGFFILIPYCIVYTLLYNESNDKRCYNHYYYGGSFSMNMLEQYLVPGYQVREMTAKEKQQAKIPVEERWIWYDGKINCYGSVSKISRPFFIDDWKTTESQGYFMA